MQTWNGLFDKMEKKYKDPLPISQWENLQQFNIEILFCSTIDPLESFPCVLLNSTSIW
jgi:hypothetical protein